MIHAEAYARNIRPELLFFSERPFGGNTALFSQPTAVQNQSPWYPRQFGLRRSMLTALHITYLISTCLDPAVVLGRNLSANPGL